MKLKDKKRQSILDAAVEEFRLHGFDAARVDSIARRAQVSKRTLYNHFPSKQKLFDAIVEVLMAEAATVPTPDLDPGRPLRDQLILALEAYVRLVTDPRYLSLSRLLAAEYMRDQELARRILTRPELYTSPVARILERAMDTNQLRRADPAVVAGQILALVKNDYFWPQFMFGADPVPTNERMADCVDIILGHYAADPPVTPLSSPASPRR